MYRCPLCHKYHNMSCVWYVSKYCVTCLSTKNKFRIFPCNHMCCCRCMTKLCNSYLPLQPIQSIQSSTSTLQPFLEQQSRMNQSLQLDSQQPPFLGPRSVFHKTTSEEEFSSDDWEQNQRYYIHIVNLINKYFKNTYTIHNDLELK